MKVDSDPIRLRCVDFTIVDSSSTHRFVLVIMFGPICISLVHGLIFTNGAKML